MNSKYEVEMIDTALDFLAAADEDLTLLRMANQPRLLVEQVALHLVVELVALFDLDLDE